MTWENVKRKLTSRKFWVMLMTLVGIVCVVLNVDSFTTEKMMGVISAFSILLVYIIGETVTDIANKKVTGEVIVASVASKLSSRKFWAAIISFITVLLVTLGVNALTIEQVRTLILGIGTVAVYILGESAIDASKITSDILTEEKNFENDVNSLLGEVATNIKPMVSGWTKMIVTPKNGSYADMFSDPNYEMNVGFIDAGQVIYVENKIYEEKFYRFVTDEIVEDGQFCTFDGDSHLPLFIAVSEVSNEDDAASKPAEEIDSNGYGYAQTEATYKDDETEVRDEAYSSDTSEE